MAEITAHSGLLSTVKVHVEDTGGKGRPVVLIHGWPLSGESWKDQVPALQAAGLRAITYDRRGFGRSDKPSRGYDYDTLADDLDALIRELDLRDVSLVGFSMGGGEVARYIARHGEDRLHSVVFAAAVPPYLEQTSANPEGPLTKEQAAGLEAGLTADRVSFFDRFTTAFFSVDGILAVSEAQRLEAIALAHQSDQKAALKCMASFGTTDFREDLLKVTVPTLVVHGAKDAVVPFEGSGRRTHEIVTQSELVLIDDAPHGLNVSHVEPFNNALLGFLTR